MSCYGRFYEAMNRATAARDGTNEGDTASNEIIEEYCRECSTFEFLENPCDSLLETETGLITVIDQDIVLLRHIEQLKHYLNNYDNELINASRNINNFIDQSLDDNEIPTNERILEIMRIFQPPRNSKSDILKNFLVNNEFILENNYNLDEETWNKRIDKCNRYTCSEDCNNTDNDECYWDIPFNLNHISNSKCQCKPNIFITDMNDYGFNIEKSLQRELSEDFYINKSEEFNEVCTNNSIMDSFRETIDVEGVQHNLHRELSQMCQKFRDYYHISEAIFSEDSSSSFIQGIINQCEDKNSDEENRNNNEKCKNSPLRLCSGQMLDDIHCSDIDITYYDLYIDLFSYYLLRNTSYENKDWCECNLLEIIETGCYNINKNLDGSIDIIRKLPNLSNDECSNTESRAWIDSHYKMDKTEYIPKNMCEDNYFGIPNGVCYDNKNRIKNYLDKTIVPETDDSEIENIMNRLLDKTVCKRINSIEEDGEKYFHSRYYCDPLIEKVPGINIEDTINEMINKGFYDLEGEYKISNDRSLNFDDNILRIWNEQEEIYEETFDDSLISCNSPINKCMGFESEEIKDYNYYETLLNSHYYFLPLESTNKITNLGFMRSFKALNNYYLGDYSISFNYGQYYGKFIRWVYNATVDETLAPTMFLNEYEILTALESGEDFSAAEYSVASGSNQIGGDIEEVYRENVIESLQSIYHFDTLNSIRDYSLIFICIIILLIFIYIYFISYLFLPHILWIIFYFIKEYFKK